MAAPCTLNTTPHLKRTVVRCLDVGNAANETPRPNKACAVNNVVEVIAMLPYLHK